MKRIAEEIKKLVHEAQYLSETISALMGYCAQAATSILQSERIIDRAENLDEGTDNDEIIALKSYLSQAESKLNDLKQRIEKSQEELKRIEKGEDY
jgi:predicted  nucleic acid-binding Zn-ribbon protein